MIDVFKKEFWYKMMFNLNFRLEKSQLSCFESSFKMKFHLRTLNLRRYHIKVRRRYVST